MSGTRKDIARAEAEAAAARARLQDTAMQLRSRLDPRVRAREVWGDARDRGETLADDAVEFAYERHRPIAIVVGIGALLLVRKPLARLLSRLHRPRRPKWDTPDTDVRRINPAGFIAAGSRGE